jgi:tripartite-type tricarboxylate transporter receptor subunit TctC
MPMTARKPFIALFATAAMLAASPASAQGDFPNKVIRMIVGFAAGGGNDIFARLVSQKLSERTGWTVIIENKPGAGTILGTQMVAASPPDGYTLLMGTFANAVNPSLNAKLPYDAHKDFAAVALLARSFNIVVVNPASPIKSIADLIAAAKAAPKTLTYGSPGVGTPHHLSMALVETAAGIELVHVPYKGTAGAVQDLLGGQIGYMFLPVHVSAQHIRAGKLKAIAAGSPQRLPQLPDVPTLAESGLTGVDVDMWYGFFAPKDTPPELVDRLNKEIAAILNSPEAKAAFEAQGLIPATSTPKALGEIVVRDKARWADVVAKRGIKPE